MTLDPNPILRSDTNLVMDKILEQSPWPTMKLSGNSRIRRYLKSSYSTMALVSNALRDGNIGQIATILVWKA